MRAHKDDGPLAVAAYIHGWRQNDSGAWFKPGVPGTFESAAKALDAEERIEASK